MNSQKLQLALKLLGEAASEGEHTLDELWAMFRRGRQLAALTWRGYDYIWAAQFQPRFGAMKPSELTPDHVLKWREGRAKEATRTRSPKTTPGCRNSELRVLRSMLSWCAKCGLIGRNPIASVELEIETGTRETVITPEQIAAVERHASREDWALFTVGITSGMRKNEMRVLRWEDIDLDTGVVRVRSKTAKRKKGRTVVIGRVAVEALRALQADTTTPHRQGSPWVWPSSRYAGKRPIAPQTITWRWGELRKRAGLKGPDGDIVLHDTRRTWGSNSVQQQLPLPDILALGGWSNPPTFIRHYYRITPARLAEIRKAMDATGKGARKPPRRPPQDDEGAPPLKIYKRY